ncbi:hypothetical protein DH2020_027446 [Rehmannia glutinosa]|uniref:FAR1 domain-containing protein n=1 Tax=Rehmannia glutinosa TaxID=99300 RepID=A0ABR0VWY9_REHGL
MDIIAMDIIGRCEIRRDTKGGKRNSLLVAYVRGPYEGMVFDSEAAARAYYNEYVGRASFLTHILSSRKSERDGSILSRGIGCRNILSSQKSGNISNEFGEKRRDGFIVMLLVKRERGGRWIVRKFVRDHNHPLVGFKN